MTKKKVEMFWDIGSTNAYFALHLIKPILKRTNSDLILHPYNLGFAFRSRNYVLMEEPAIKIENRKVDLARWAKKYNLKIIEDSADTIGYTINKKNTGKIPKTSKIKPSS